MLNAIFFDAMPSSLSLIIIFMIAALAALISERAGVINIGIEGQMIFAGFGYSLITYSNYVTGNESNHKLATGAILVGIIFGMMLSLLHSLMVLKFKINHIISGTVINIVGPALAAFGAILLNQRSNISSNIQYVPWQINQIVFFPFILLLLAIMIVCFINFTKFGLRLKSVGENPWAGQSVGINVIRYKFLAITISGALSGLAGSLYVITQSIFIPSAGGYGFIAIAIMILARWNGWLIILSSIIWGYIFNFTYYATPIKEITDKINPLLLRSLFFLTPLISLLVFRFIYNKRLTGVPQALGVVFYPSN